VVNTAVRYLGDHPDGEPTPDREPPGTRRSDTAADRNAHRSQEPVPPPEPSLNPNDDDPAVAPAGAKR
jgi:hypothetical protein